MKEPEKIYMGVDAFEFIEKNYPVLDSALKAIKTYDSTVESHDVSYRQTLERAERVRESGIKEAEKALKDTLDRVIKG